MSDEPIPNTDDVNINGYCDCFRLDMEETLTPCGGCDEDVKLHRSVNDNVHWKGKHWHLACLFEDLVRRRSDGR